MFEFSTPMPYTIENIDKLLEINNNVEKSRITSLYFSLSPSCHLFTGFEQYRNSVDKDWDYWKKLISHALTKADIIYLLNAPVFFDIANADLQLKLNILDDLLNELKKIGVNKLRVTNNQLLSYIHLKYPDFNLYASTSMEYQNIFQYRNFLYIHPYIKQIVPSHDSNKNFHLLKNLNFLAKDIDIEIMVNEGCLNGCPLRRLHSYEKYSSDYYFNFFCEKFQKEQPFETLVKSNNIYPWEIEEYSKIGINKFKFVGRDVFKEKINERLEDYLLYLKGIDSIKNIENIPVSRFIHHLSSNKILKQITVKEVRGLLPQINHFKKHGELCSSNCGINCRYCYKCADKIEKTFNKKQTEIKLRSIPVCVQY